MTAEPQEFGTNLGRRLNVVEPAHRKSPSTVFVCRRRLHVSVLRTSECGACRREALADVAVPEPVPVDEFVEVKS